MIRISVQFRYGFLVGIFKLQIIYLIRLEFPGNDPSFDPATHEKTYRISRYFWISRSPNALASNPNFEGCLAHISTLHTFWRFRG
jgi:hypothetical protein